MNALARQQLASLASMHGDALVRRSVGEPVSRQVPLEAVAPLVIGLRGRAAMGVAPGEQRLALLPVQDGNRTTAAPVFVLPRPVPPAPRKHFELLQSFEGTVLRVDGEEFSARLRDTTSPERPDEDATFDLGEVPNQDRELLVPGAVFYWSIGYETEAGQKRRVSVIRLRRLPAWSQRDVKRAEAAASELDHLFG